MTHRVSSGELPRTLGTWPVFAAGVALVVAASTLVSDFSGYLALGYAFAAALAAGFLINALLGVSAADLSVAYPRAGALYDYARNIVGGKRGRFLGLFLGLTFYGMFALGMSGETAAGAHGLKAMLGIDAHLNYYVIAICVMAVLPNIFGLKTTAWISGALLLFMLGIRWFFGIAGFLGFSQTGAWSAANLDAGITIGDWFGSGGILAAGLALAFWSFVGIEFACSLAEEVKEPKKNMPRGIILGLAAILGTSLIMVLGVGGTMPVESWRTAVAGELGAGGESPQLAVGYLMFGKAGYYLMALASVTASLGSRIIAFAVMPRVIFSIARDGLLFGNYGKTFAGLHPKYNSPINATLLTFAIYLIPSLFSTEVIDWLYSAAYVWILLYLGFHLLAIVNRLRNPGSETAFGTGKVVTAGILGLVTTGIGLYYAFAGAHLEYGGRAAIVIAAALAVSGISWIMRWNLKSGRVYASLKHAAKLTTLK